MTSPKAASSKRANLPRASDFSKSFRKDWERLAHSGRFDLRRLKAVMILLIANDGPLGAEWQDHALTGDWAAHRECHAGGDFLLIYRLDGKAPHETIIFVRAGTHSELFE
jgi:mRNA interferase YafQ